MTTLPDPLAGTPLALSPTPQGMVGFGAGELGYIAASGDTEAARISRDFLGVQTPDEVALFLGASSLTAKGMLGTREGHLEARGHAALLQIALSTAVRWTRVGVLSDDPAVVFVLQCPDLAVLIEPAALASWWVMYGDDPSTAPTLIEALVRDRLDAHPDAGCIIDSRGAGSDRRNVLLTKDGDSFKAMADVDPGGSGGTPITVPEGNFGALLDHLMAV